MSTDKLNIDYKILLLADGWYIEDKSLKYISWGLVTQLDDIIHRVRYEQEKLGVAILLTDGEIFEIESTQEQLYTKEFFVKNPTSIEIPLGESGKNRYNPWLKNAPGGPTFIIVPNVEIKTIDVPLMESEEDRLKFTMPDGDTLDNQYEENRKFFEKYKNDLWRDDVMKNKFNENIKFR